MIHSHRFQKAISQLGMPDPRHATRYRCDLVALLTPLGVSDSGHLIHVVDLSCGGAKLLIRFSIEVGECVQVDLCSEQSSGPHTLQIQYILPFSRDELLVGGVWVRPLSEAHVKALVENGHRRHVI